MSVVAQNIFNLLQEINVLDPGFRFLIWQRALSLTEEKLVHLSDLLMKTVQLQEDIFSRAARREAMALSRADRQQIKKVKKLIKKL